MLLEFLKFWFLNSHILAVLSPNLPWSKYPLSISTSFKNVIIFKFVKINKVFPDRRPKTIFLFRTGEMGSRCRHLIWVNKIDLRIWEIYRDNKMTFIGKSARMSKKRLFVKDFSKLKLVRLHSTRFHQTNRISKSLSKTKHPPDSS